MEKISIALATYNGEKYIEKQLDSIRNQIVKATEVIIVDDRSCDKTAEIIEKYILKYELVNWKFFINKENLGYKKNFYNILQKVTGEIIFLADQDDEWHEDKIEIMMKIMQEHSQIKALNSAVILIDESSNKVIQNLEKNYYNANFLYLNYVPKEIEYFDISYIGLHNISPGCTMALRREIIDIFLYSYNYRLPHDWFMNLIAAAYGGCAFLNVPLIDYRRHGNNAIGANTKPIVGMLNKTRRVRIEDYSSRNEAIQRVLDVTGINMSNKIKKVIDLNDDMIDFYKNPNPIKLFRLRTDHLYFELAKKKIRMWEFFVSFGLDKLIINLLKRRK